MQCYAVAPNVFAYSVTISACEMGLQPQAAISFFVLVHHNSLA